MIETWEKMIEVGTDFNDEFNLTRYNVYKDVALKGKVLECVKLDKPIKIFTGQELGIKFEDRETYYYIYFGQGKQFPKEKEGFAWLSDEHSIFFFERPYTGKVLNVLKKLLPNESVTYSKNDIYINGTKNGSSLRTGYNKQQADYIEGTEIIKSDALSGMIYILRWDDLDGLNKSFEGIAHHQKRLNEKPALSTLSDFIKDMSREQFMSHLENTENIVDENI